MAKVGASTLDYLRNVLYVWRIKLWPVSLLHNTNIHFRNVDVYCVLTDVCMAFVFEMV